LNPAVRFVQFLDGDCEMAAGWIEVAVEKLQAATQVGVVCGRLRERSPQASIYNRLCEIEWDRPVGETTACGGNCMMRVDAFQGVGGFDPTVIAAEDDEICLRLRRKGWKVFMLGEEMATHDAAMTRLRQWWRRSVRSGYAYAQGASMHGGSSERHFARENLRAWFWGFVIPAVAIGAAWPSRGISLFLLLLYPGQLWRIYVQTRSRRLSRRDAAAYAGACMVSKFAEFVGLLRYYLKHIRRTPIQLIEHR
jgi:cellulose synthase/poly-beta-1,6-N-acetylglucosamine synthase-like glycosyltransferase